MKTKRGRILREPHGVIGIISPWNYPLSIPAVDALGALVTGNAVVLKPSEFTSLVALRFQTLLRAAGVPRSGRVDQQPLRPREFRQLQHQPIVLAAERHIGPNGRNILIAMNLTHVAAILSAHQGIFPFAPMRPRR